MAAFHRAFAEPAAPLTQTAAVASSWSRRRPSLQPSGGRASGSARRWTGSVAPPPNGPLPLGAWHGDWTPWNMSRRRGRLQLWDWERFETGVPLGLDRCHYGVNAVVRRDGARASPR